MESLYHIVYLAPTHYKVGAGVTYAVGQVAVYEELSVVWIPSVVFIS